MMTRWRFLLALVVGCSLSLPASTQDRSTAVDPGNATLLPEPTEPRLPEPSAVVDEKPPTFLKNDWQAPAEPPTSRSAMKCTESVDEDGNAIKHCKPVPVPDGD